MEKVKEYIEKNYSKYDLENSYQDYCDRYDDCFEAGYEKGYSKALLDIGKSLGMDLEVPENYEDED